MAVMIVVAQKEWMVHMAERDQNNSLFRKKVVDRISSPEQLTMYLRVTNPGIWTVLAAVILLMAGILVWSAVGTLETTVDAKVVVEDHTAQVFPVKRASDMQAGMLLRVSSVNAAIASVGEDEYGRAFGKAEIFLPDGTYEGEVVIEQIHPIRFLTGSGR